MKNAVWHRYTICFACALLSTLFSANARFGNRRQRLMRSVRMQWTLAFLETPPVEQQTPGRLDEEARSEALRILARMIAQCFQATIRTEQIDE
jgi:hypothetical protein